MLSAMPSGTIVLATTHYAQAHGRQVAMASQPHKAPGAIAHKPKPYAQRKASDECQRRWTSDAPKRGLASIDLRA